MHFSQTSKSRLKEQDSWGLKADVGDLVLENPYRVCVLTVVWGLVDIATFNKLVKGHEAL